MAAEALALGASIAAFIQLADRITSLARNVVDSTADMPTTLRMAHAETSALKDVLGELKRTHATSGVEANTALMEATKKPLENCHSSMEKLEAELAKLSISPSAVRRAPGKRQKVTQAVKWAAGGEDRVKKLVSNLVTEKATLSLVLLSDISEDVKAVKSTTAKVYKNLTDKQILNVVKWLEHTNPCDIHNRSGILYEERTGEWMLRSKEWNSFVRGGNRSLWIHGIPGAGKTILISHLVNKLRLLHNRRTGWAYYYCYFGRTQDETEPFLRWIISQLCQQASHVPSQLQGLYERRHRPDINTSLAVLAQITQEFDVVYVVIDAVDESKPYTRLLEILTSLITQPRFAKLRLLISSRQYLDIENALQPHSVSVSMSNEAVQEDIRIFVSATLRSNPKFQSWPVSLYTETEAALAKEAKGMFRWAVCQIDILGRMKSQSAVRKALAELPETLDATYERILHAIPTEHREFTRAALSILAAQSDFGDSCSHMTPRVLLSMILRTIRLDMSTDHFYDISDIREICGCLVTFVTQNKSGSNLNTIGPEPLHSGVVFLAHYTVKEFLYAERTARSLNSTVSRFALDEETTAMCWAKDIVDIASSTKASGDPISMDLLEDYCQGLAPKLLGKWDNRLAASGLSNRCFTFLNPGGAHHLLRMKRMLILEWSSTPANHLIGALAECLYRGLWALAREATQMLDAKQILGAALLLIADTGSRPPDRFQSRRSEVLLETSLVLSLFIRKLQPKPRLEQLKILAKSVGWDALLFAATAQHRYDKETEKGKTCAIALLVELGANVNSASCRMTPLQLAALLWDYDGVKVLLEKRADANMTGSAQGYQLAGCDLDDDLEYDSPLRILRNAAFAPPRSSIRVRRAGQGRAAKLKVEKLLLESGARDFTTKL
ncbi:hypothetical protein B0T26DRAFT_701172 [Lasiosphaeria miniovina]|uniref:NACHT domain-containing protein n=1 Tax=Lasiosphaeria miniovina TaxID=1954250 RepID=A0AA40AU49_9PEZI|nr:uncharacterized protein B0T26DRAFT_701172 [Lasiosphaeria miniovina]KAK0722057.1 hypothetical protein B0T26DRAFT_701172 [Lasiosphaeria miniovina]